MLIEEIKNGNSESFDELMQVHQRKVYQIAFSYAKSSQEAMDITQNIFLKVYKNVNQFRGDSQFKTWLMRITYNEGQNWVKKNRRHLMNEDIYLLLTLFSTITLIFYIMWIFNELQLILIKNNPFNWWCIISLFFSIINTNYFLNKAVEFDSS